MCLRVNNLYYCFFYYYIGMNFSSIKKGVTHGVALVLLASTLLSSVVLADTSIAEQVQEVNKGTGGSNPLVVARLRAEGLARQKKLAEQEAVKRLPEPSVVINSLDSRYNTQELPPYIPDFKTIGDVQAELTAVVMEEELIEKSERLTSIIESSDFTTQFSDIENSNHKDDIIILDALNIISGRENTKFKPNERVTRKEAIKISALISGKDIYERNDSSVADIDSSDWSVPYVESLIDNDIISLDSEKTLEGDLPLTADEAFVLYLLTARVCIDFDEKAFPFYSAFKGNYSSDIEISHYETDLVEGEKITREDFVELSIQVLNALSVRPDYSPAVQLLGRQYSASQRLDEEYSVRSVLREVLNK